MTLSLDIRADVAECQHCRHWSRIPQRSDDARLPTGLCSVGGKATPKRPVLPVRGYRETCGRFAERPA